MKRFRFTPLQLAVHLAALLPLAWLIKDYLTDNLTVNPIQAATQRTGDYAIVLLLLSLAVTPIITLTGYSALLEGAPPTGSVCFSIRRHSSFHFCRRRLRLQFRLPAG
jgi:methionine sulfoxide reductase heme-binding subunit